MLAEVTAYNVGVFLHLLAVIVGLGVTFAYPVVLAFMDNFAPRSVPAAWAALKRVDRIMVSPGLLVILLSGLYLLGEGEISFGESWVTVGLAAVIALLGLTHAYFRPRWNKGIEIAERDLKSGDELSDEFREVSRQMAIGGMTASLIVLVTLFFMTVKP